ncbi:hypothetical protein [Streptomyces sp. MUSC 125]|uniref:hypothetical protein n=1 Tax=Streptomyces sp. MUSC 125 TaxID=1428624 RepID=UPI000689744B|nr:hypothetical protein [Streptomyces sp. MUSC 125]
MTGPTGHRRISGLSSLGNWTQEDSELYESARSLIIALMAAYSARLDAEGLSADEQQRLEQEQRQYIAEQRSLRLGDRAAAERVLAEYPARLREVRGEAW